MQLFNPAFTSEYDGKSAFIQTNRNLRGIKDAQTINLLSYSGLRKKNLAYGFSIISDKLFIEKQTHTNLDFSYKINLSEISSIFFGINAGALFYNSDPTGLNSSLDSNSDPLKRGMSRTFPHLGVGIKYITNRYWISVSLPRLIYINSNEINIRNEYKGLFLASGTLFNINENLQLKPSLIFRTNSNFRPINELTAFFNWKDKFELGASRQSTGISSIMATLRFNNTQFGISNRFSNRSFAGQDNLLSNEIFFKIFI